MLLLLSCCDIVYDMDCVVSYNWFIRDKLFEDAEHRHYWRGCVDDLDHVGFAPAGSMGVISLSVVVTPLPL